MRVIKLMCGQYFYMDANHEEYRNHRNQEKFEALEMWFFEERSIINTIINTKTT